MAATCSVGTEVAAALYTMHLSSCGIAIAACSASRRVCAKLNNELVKVVKTDESFATAVCGLIDLRNACSGLPERAVLRCCGWEPTASPNVTRPRDCRWRLWRYPIRRSPNGTAGGDRCCCSATGPGDQ